MPRKVPLAQPTKKFDLRCSSLPLFFSCTQALLNTEKLTPVRVENGLENLGTYIHEAIQRAVETGEINLSKIERMMPGEAERAHALFNNGIKVVQQAKLDMENPQFEAEVKFETEKYLVTGHVDILDMQPTRAFVVDFKTGRTRDDHYHQMAGYAVGAWTLAGRPDNYTVHIAYVYLEDGESTPFALTADDMRDWLRELDSKGTQFTVNRRCVYCPLHDSCKTFRTYVKGAVSFLTDTASVPESLAEMDGTTRSKLATVMKVASDSVDRIRSYIKNEAIKSGGGDMDLGNGNKFTLVRSKRNMLLTQKALPILAKYVTAKDIAKASTLSLSSLLTAASMRAKGPMRAILREELAKALEKGGAILTTEQVQLRTVFAKDKSFIPKEKNNVKKRR